MKRFLLFTGDDYYPAGGWGDFQDSYDTLIEATSAKTTGDWWHVIDATNGEELANSYD
jgi:hypothetical protein